MMTATEVFYAHGHKNIIATHKTTFEVTKERSLTQRGNCIVGVKSTKSGVDLPLEFKNALKKDDALITITFETDGQKEIIKAMGNKKIQLTHPTDFVIRKSEYVCSRTLAIRADKSSFDFSRKFVEKLKDPNQILKIILKVENQ